MVHAPASLHWSEGTIFDHFVYYHLLGKYTFACENVETQELGGSIGKGLIWLTVSSGYLVNGGNPTFIIYSSLPMYLYEQNIAEIAETHDRIITLS